MSDRVISLAVIFNAPPWANEYDDRLPSNCSWLGINPALDKLMLPPLPAVIWFLLFDHAPPFALILEPCARIKSPCACRLIFPASMGNVLRACELMRS